MKRLTVKVNDDTGKSLAKKKLQSKANSLLNAEQVDIKTLKGFVQLLVSLTN